MSLGFKGEMPVVHCNDGRVKKEFRKACNINTIVAKYRRTGMVSSLNQARPVFADVSQIGDFRSIVHRVRRAEEAFEALPAYVRKRFNHDSAQLVAFMQDEKNRDEAIKLGLIEKPEVVEEDPSLPGPAGDEQGDAAPPAKKA